MKTYFYLLVLMVLTFFASLSSFSQSSSAIPGNGKITNTGNFPSGENLSNCIKPNTNNNIYTGDEYGSLGLNGVLGGLGTAAKYVLINYNNIFDQNADGTIEAWIKPSVLNSTMTIISKSRTSASSFVLGVSSSTSKLFFRIGSTVFSDGVSPVLIANVWTHVAVTWVNSGANYTVTFYVNGVAGSSSTFAATWSLLNDSVRIGANQNWGEPFQGYIDEVRFWNTVRTQAQIADNKFIGIGDCASANANNGLISGNAYSGLISSWTFNTVTSVIDDIGGYNGQYIGGCGSYNTDIGYPLPYNQALYIPETSTNSYVANVVSNNYYLSLLTEQGSIDAWVNPSDNTSAKYIITKGATHQTTSFSFYLNSYNELGFYIGSPDVVISTGHYVPVNTWSHVAITWQHVSPLYYDLQFYLNGVAITTTGTILFGMPINNDSIRIGSSQIYPGNTFKGYIDEVRIWQYKLPYDTLRKYMFTSARSILTPQLFCAWIFDGNLNSYGSLENYRGRFVGDARFSGYSNENSNTYSYNLNAHKTTITRSGFPKGFNIHAIDGFVGDGAMVFKDTINVLNHPGNVNDIEIFIDINHTRLEDLKLELKSPGGANVIMANGLFSNCRNGYLTVFDDSANTAVNGNLLLPPFSPSVRPQNSFTPFKNTVMNGKWILTVTDLNANYNGRVIGWGIRLNNENSVGIEPTFSNVINKFSLYQNYPNPFNPTTKIKFDILSPVSFPNVSIRNPLAQLIIYDILGKEVTTLVNENLSPGTYEVEWNAENIPSGIYFYQLKTENYTETKKMLLIK
jgi:subtilisin-like proprotein convertase family protein